MSDSTNYLYPRHRYSGQLDPHHLAFNANSCKFAQRVTYISCLQTDGKLTPEDAFHRIAELWEQMQLSKKHLHVKP